MLRARLSTAYARCARQTRAASTSARSPPSGLKSAALGLGAGVLLTTAFFLTRPTQDDSRRHAVQSKARPATPAGSPGIQPSAPRIDADTLAQELRRALDDASDALGRVSTDPEVLHVHGYSENDHHPSSSPTVVVYPRSTADVVEIVKLANQYLVPIVTYGGGTAIEGHWRAPPGGAICVDMRDMDRILEIHEEDSDLVCQPGIGWMEVNAELKRRGIPLFFPLDPGPGASIGGMISTGCSGTNAVRYGTARGEWFLNVTVVLPSGEVVKTRRRARKSSAGFDVTKLFIGAEGTLGIITEVTIRLAPVLPTTVVVVQFPDVRAASEAARDIVNSGVGIQCVELVDDAFMRATNLYGQSARKWPEKDALFLRLQGPTAASMHEGSRIIAQICETHGGSGFTRAADAAEADALWADRKNALYSTLALVDGSRACSTDVCVPVSRLPELVHATKRDIAASGIVGTLIGHAGDGNFHAVLLFGTEAERAVVRGLVHRMVERAIRLDGTCTGEHGVGIGKRGYLRAELGDGTVRLLWTLKRALDLHNLFNPGKLYPDIEVP